MFNEFSRHGKARGPVAKSVGRKGQRELQVRRARGDDGSCRAKERARDASRQPAEKVECPPRPLARWRGR